MAFEIFIDIDGVKGESPVKGEEEKIQVLAWSWGMSQTGTTHHGSGGGAGKVNVQDLSFTHYADKSSPVLMQACCTGKHFASATLSMRKAGGDPLKFYRITMTDVIISSVSSGSSAGEDMQTENVTLNFAAVEVAYQPQDNKGAKKGGEITCKYDIAKNTV